MSDNNRISKILLVDDHPLLREGLGRLITAETGLSICGMAGSVQEALAHMDSDLPDLIITDLTLPGRNGLELIKDLGATHPEIPIIVLSMHDEMVYAERVLRAGGRGYVMKDTPPDRLLEAIRVVLAGGIFASQTVTDHLLRTLSSGKNPTKPGYPLECLTDREMEVFELIGHAKSNHEIASQLGISPRTLDAHRAHIREKLGLADSNELTRHAIRWVEVGLIQS
ncbi:MAG: response regulator transcription factor [Luteolibacter sp.]|jgi:DNA-binding NarL/FixJ family response regulator|nr:response regulator transcription factor [Luteolibacter sp.]